MSTALNFSNWIVTFCPNSQAKNRFTNVQITESSFKTISLGFGLSTDYLGIWKKKSFERRICFSDFFRIIFKRVCLKLFILLTFFSSAFARCRALANAFETFPKNWKSCFLHKWKKNRNKNRKSKFFGKKLGEPKWIAHPLN